MKIFIEDDDFDFIRGVMVIDGEDMGDGIMCDSVVFISEGAKLHHSATGCHHQNKYINEAGGIKFWVCPQCKMDLGDA